MWLRAGHHQRRPVRRLVHAVQLRPGQINAEFDISVDDQDQACRPSVVPHI